MDRYFWWQVVNYRKYNVLQFQFFSVDKTRDKILRVYMDTYKPAYAIKLSAKNFGFEDNQKIVSLYAACCI